MMHSVYKTIEGKDDLSCPFCDKPPKITKYPMEGAHPDHDLFRCETQCCPASRRATNRGRWNNQIAVLRYQQENERLTKQLGDYEKMSNEQMLDVDSLARERDRLQQENAELKEGLSNLREAHIIQKRIDDDESQSLWKLMTAIRALHAQDQSLRRESDRADY